MLFYVSATLMFGPINHNDANVGINADVYVHVDGSFWYFCSHSEAAGGPDLEVDKQQLEHFLTVSKVCRNRKHENLKGISHHKISISCHSLILLTKLLASDCLILEPIVYLFVAQLSRLWSRRRSSRGGSTTGRFQIEKKKIIMSNKRKISNRKEKSYN